MPISFILATMKKTSLEVFALATNNTMYRKMGAIMNRDKKQVLVDPKELSDVTSFDHHHTVPNTPAARLVDGDVCPYACYLRLRVGDSQAAKELYADVQRYLEYGGWKGL